ncbi:hypothetical protein GGG16DRAFT_67812, partial [Schizophyllum commune]
HFQMIPYDPEPPEARVRSPRASKAMVKGPLHPPTPSCRNCGSSAAAPNAAAKAACTTNCTAPRRRRWV